MLALPVPGTLSMLLKCIYVQMCLLYNKDQIYTHVARLDLHSCGLHSSEACALDHTDLQVCSTAALVKICTLEVLCHQVRTASPASLRVLEPLKCGYACCTCDAS